MKLPKPKLGLANRLFAMGLIIIAINIVGQPSFVSKLIAAMLLFTAIRELIADSKSYYKFTTMFDKDILSPAELDENGNSKILFRKGMQITPSRINFLIEQGVETFPVKVDYGQDNVRT